MMTATPMTDPIPKLFGTDGIRARWGEEPLTGPTVTRIGAALAATIRSTAKSRPLVVAGRDTRASGPAILAALATGLAQGGVELQDLGIVSTPGVAFCTRKMGAAAGVVISASHNPAHDNGIKVFGADGMKLADALEEEIERAVHAGAAVNAENKHAPTSTTAAAMVADYERALMGAGEEVGGTTKPFLGRTLVVDCANGATHDIAPRVLRALGADVIEVACSPDGANINDRCGALHPQTLAAAVKRHRADGGVTFDGDGDRVMVLDEQGRVLDGDFLLAILARAFRNSGGLPGSAVVGTVMANIGLELSLADIGVTLTRVSVGDRFVVARMVRDALILGGEQSGHIVIFRHGFTTGDGLLTALHVLAHAWRGGQSLGNFASVLTKYPQILLNVPVRDKPPFETLPGVTAILAGVEAELKGRGRVVLRYSGTERLARVMVEGPDEAATRLCAENIADAIREEIGVDIDHRNS